MGAVGWGRFSAGGERGCLDGGSAPRTTLNLCYSPPLTPPWATPSDPSGSWREKVILEWEAQPGRWGQGKPCPERFLGELLKYGLNVVKEGGETWRGDPHRWCLPPPTSLQGPPRQAKSQGKCFDHSESEIHSTLHHLCWAFSAESLGSRKWNLPTYRWRLLPPTHISACQETLPSQKITHHPEWQRPSEMFCVSCS